jgi:8-oxo-dGTP pyrophosphatase MutT (NUDIX family)
MAKSFNQAGVVPVRGGLVGLVTSSNGKRWVVPKGGVDPGYTPREAAAKEAWEEAGWVGMPDAEPIGNYTYVKEGRRRQVLVFRMLVTEVHADWPEMSFRTREWVTPDEAIERIEEPELQALIRDAADVKA